MNEHIEEAHRLATEAQRIAGLPLLYARFLDHDEAAIVIVDRAGNIALFNRKAQFLFGYTAEEVIGKPVEMLLPESVRSLHEQHRATFMGDPYPRAMGAQLDLKARNKDGEEIPVLIDLHPEMSTAGPYVRAAIRRKEA